MTEFLVNIVIGVPDSVSTADRELLIGAERRRAAELTEDGTIVRLWRDPERWANWGLWLGADRDEVQAAVDSLPLRPYMTVDIHELAAHPSDPGRSDGAPSAARRR